MSKGTRKTSPLLIPRSSKKPLPRSLVLATAFIISLVALLPASLLRVAEAGDNQWTALGPEGGTVMSLVVDPSNSQIVYAVTFGAGVFKSTDAGATWVASNAGLKISALYALSIDPTN